jgi:hypothetical protein
MIRRNSLCRSLTCYPSVREEEKKKLPARKASINEYEEGLSIVRYLTE